MKKHDHNFELEAKHLARRRLADGQFMYLLKRRGIDPRLIQDAYNEATTDVMSFLAQKTPKHCLICEPGFVLIELLEAKHEQT